MVPAGCAQTAAAPADAVAGPTDPAVLAGMLLHLPDAPVGATVGDDSSCQGGGHSAEGDSDAFLDLVAQTGNAIEGCFIQLEAPDLFVNSLVLSFPSVDSASKAMTPEAFDGVVRYYGLGCCNGESVGEPMEGAAPTGGTFEAVSASDTAAILVWRDGPVVGAVSVRRFDGETGALAEAHRLAAIQDERMRSPVALAADVDEDRLVGLQQAEFPAWWVGETFAPPGYPPTELYMSYSSTGMVDLDYQPALRIELFDRSAIAPGSEPDQMLGVTDELFDSPCTVRKPINSPAGEATLLARHIPDEYMALGRADAAEDGWGGLLDEQCPVGDPNLWMATVETTDGVLIRINGALCYLCLTPPDPDLPYRSPEGIRAVAAALQPFT